MTALAPSADGASWAVVAHDVAFDAPDAAGDDAAGDDPTAARDDGPATAWPRDGAAAMTRARKTVRFA